MSKTFTTLRTSTLLNDKITASTKKIDDVEKACAVNTNEIEDIKKNVASIRNVIADDETSIYTLQTGLSNYEHKKSIHKSILLIMGIVMIINLILNFLNIFGII